MPISNSPPNSWAPLTAWTCLSLTGADRVAFLQNFCTNDVKKVAANRAQEAFVTDVKGRIVGQMLILPGRDQLRIWTVPGQTERLIEHLDRYILREDVVLEEASDQWQLISLTFVDGAAPKLGVEIPADSVFGMTQGELPPHHFQLGRWDWFGPASGWLEVAADSAEAVETSLTDGGVPQVELALLEQARVRGGTPLFGIDFGETNFPQEVNRDEQAISFTKGCYLGQETVARIDALGHVNKKICRIEFAAELTPAAGQELTLDGASVGQVTSAVSKIGEQPAAGLAMLRSTATSPGTRLEHPDGVATVLPS